MMKKYFYPVIFEPEDIGVSVYVPDIPGCFTQGDSLEEALDYIADDELADWIASTAIFHIISKDKNP